MKRDSLRYKLKPTQPAYSVCCRCILATLIAAIMLIAVPTWAESPGNRQVPVNQDEGQQPELSTKNVAIQKKTLRRVYTFGGSFAVNNETVILGTDGKEVSIKKMLVPCDAKVSYLVENGALTAKRIDILRVASDASWQWDSDHPE